MAYKDTTQSDDQLVRKSSRKLEEIAQILDSCFKDPSCADFSQSTISHFEARVQILLNNLRKTPGYRKISGNQNLSNLFCKIKWRLLTLKVLLRLRDKETGSVVIPLRSIKSFSPFFLEDLKYIHEQFKQYYGDNPRMVEMIRNYSTYLVDTVKEIPRAWATEWF